MLPPFIIEQIRKREEDALPAQPFVELPLPAPPPRPRRQAEEEDEGERGVVIIEL